MVMERCPSGGEGLRGGMYAGRQYSYGGDV